MPAQNSSSSGGIIVSSLCPREVWVVLRPFVAVRVAQKDLTLRIAAQEREVVLYLSHLHHYYRPLIYVDSSLMAAFARHQDP